ncbi:MAG TPA: hypothetical protein VHD36_14310 [Pirellulales bacterium]|nr:hypothetical protein [Pirellulales bacterium]
MLDILLVIVLAFHLLAANLAGAAPLVCVWLDARAVRRQDRLAGELGAYLLRQSLVWLTAALALGATTLFLVWITAWEPFYATARRLPTSRFWWAIPELAVYYVCVALYLRWWRVGDSASPARRIARRTMGFFAATNLLYHFPLLFTVIGVYATRPAAADDLLIFRRAMIDPEVLSQFLHHVLASFAVVGVAVMGFALRLGRQGRPSEEVQQVATWGGWLALVPTVLQLFVGLYVLLELPERARDGLLGGDHVGTLLFGISLVGAIMLMHRLASVAFGETDRRNLIGAMALLVFVVLTMVGTRQRAREQTAISSSKSSAFRQATRDLGIDSSLEIVLAERSSCPT